MSWKRSLCLLLLSALQTRADSDPKPTKPPLWNATWTDTLKRDLLLNYDKFARPAQHFNTTRVNLDMVFRHVDLDDTRSLMTVNGWVRLMWEDEKLTWNPSDYGGLATLHLADHEIWEPDVVLYNSAVGNNVDHYGNTHCLAYPNGRILWVPPAQFSFFCDMDLTRWPFDTHTCSMKLGSWTYSGEQLDLQTDETRPVDVKVVVSEWDVVDVTKKRSSTYYACCTEPYVDIEFNVTVKRHSPSYHAVVINPAIAVVLLTLSLFWLPPHCGEKFLITGLVIIYISVFLVYFSQRLPSMGINPPLLVIFYSHSLILVCLSLICSIVTYNLSRSRHSSPVPWFIGNLLGGRLGTILMLPTHKNTFQVRSDRVGVGEEMTERHYEDDGTHEERTILPSSASNDWSVLAVAIDRIAFGLYIIIFASLAIRCVA